MKDNKIFDFSRKGFQDIINIMTKKINECVDVSNGLIPRLDDYISKVDWNKIINSDLYQNVIGEVGKTNEQLNKNKQEIEVERKRIDSFTKLAEGSTTGDAELIDARINHNGIAYSNVGESLRATGGVKTSNLNVIDAMEDIVGLKKYSNVEYEIKTNGHYDKDFNFHSSNSTNVTIDVKPNDIYRFEIKRNYNNPIYFLLNNDELLFVESVTNINEVKQYEIQIPYGCNKLVIQSEKASGYNYVLKLKNVSVSNITDKQIKQQTITHRTLEKGLQDMFVAKYNTIGEQINWIEGAYLQGDGQIVSSPLYSYCKYDVYEGQQFLLKSQRQYGACGWVILDNLGKPLKSDNYDMSTITDFEDEITIPKHGAYIGFNTNGTSFTFLKPKGTYELIKQPMFFNDLPKELIDVFDVVYGEIKDIDWIEKCFIAESGKVTSINDSNYGYAEIKVSPGEKFRITGRKAWGSVCYLVKDNSGNILMHDGRPSNTETYITNEEFVIPENGVELCIGKYGFKELFIKNKLIIKNSVSPLNNKKILFNGDSICQGIVNGGGYAKIIKEMTGCVIENRAIGGGTLSDAPGNGHKIVRDIANMSQEADLICFEGGINDYWKGVKLGEITPMNDWTGPLDETTIIGALESIFRQSLAKWQGTPICMVFTHPIQSTRFNTAYSGGHTMQEQTESLKEVCRKYSIPYIDLMNESGGFNCNLSYISEKYTTDNDGCHPNVLGYEIFYVPPILSMLEKMIQRYITIE